MLSECRTKLFLMTGVLASLCFALGWAGAALSDPTWVFGVNMVSDLGVSEYESARILFSAGAVSAGALFAVFGAGLSLAYDGLAPRIGLLALCLAGIALVGVGLFNENTPYHLPCAITLFAAAVFSAVMVAIHTARTSQYPAAAGTLLMLAAGTVLGLTSSLPLTEAVSIIMLMAWISVTCVVIWYRRFGLLSRPGPDLS
jgi:hypothetical membrane protein